jgi:hypothetical protein
MKKCKNGLIAEVHAAGNTSEALRHSAQWVLMDVLHFSVKEKYEGG